MKKHQAVRLADWLAGRWWKAWPGRPWSNTGGWRVGTEKNNNTRLQYVWDGLATPPSLWDTGLPVAPVGDTTSTVVVQDCGFVNRKLRTTGTRDLFDFLGRGAEEGGSRNAAWLLWVALLL